MNKLEKIFKKYKQTFVCIIVFLCLFLGYFVIKALYNYRSSFLIWIQTEHGNVADWAGSIATLAAFLAIFWQVRKEGNIERDIHVEESRPRFSVLYTNTFKEDTKFLFWNKSIDKVNEIIYKPQGYRLITITNVSNNVVYDLTAILRYHTTDNTKHRTDFWTTTGVFPKETVAFIPKFKGENVDNKYIYDEFIIRFTTPTNEVGFFQMTNSGLVAGDMGLGGNAYYFVKEKNSKGVKAINQDKMIKKSDDTYKRFNSLFNECTGATSEVVKTINN